MSPVSMFAEPRPVTIVTIAILALALVATLALSRVIKRREAARAAAAALVPRPAIQAERLQRAISPAVPQDVRERLRFLTTGIDRAPGHAPLNGGGQGTAADRERPGSAVPRAGIGVPDDATRYFGDASALTPQRGGGGDGATTFFGQGLESGVNDDATRFFGDVDAGDLFGEEPQPATAPGEQDDATRFFGAVDDGDASLLSSGTQFFSPDVLDPAGGSADPGAAVTGTNSVQAPPPAWAGFDTSALNRVRERLAAAATPEVLALSLLDGAGRVLVGDTDDDLTGELRSLMAESGQGHAADLEQPVRLGDDSKGALLLLPTGANALLGALVRDAGDPQATRARLRGLAHEIGDAMQRAS